MKRKKRNKLLSVCFVLVLAAFATVGGVLAAEAMQVNHNGESTQPGEGFQVELVMQQRAYHADGTLAGLEPYEDGTMLYPLVGSAQYNGSNFDKYGMPTAEGYVDQIVRMTNTSNQPMYVRLLVAVPAALEEINGNASKNALHWNLGNRFMPEGNFSSSNHTNTAFAKYEEPIKIGTQTENGILYNVYTITYKEALLAGETTPAAAFVGFYFDKNVNIVDDKVYLNGKYTGYQGTTVDIAVKAQGVETTGHDNAEAAFAEYGVSDYPWQTSTNTIADTKKMTTKTRENQQ